MTLWRVMKSGIYVPAHQCDGIDISPIDTYIDFSNDDVLTDLGSHEGGDFTAEGWFYVVPDHEGYPPGYPAQYYDLYETLFKKMAANDPGVGYPGVGWGMATCYTAKLPGPYEPYHSWFTYGIRYHNPTRMMLELESHSEWTAAHYEIGAQVNAMHVDPLTGWHHYAITSHTWLDYGQVYGGADDYFVNNVARFFFDGVEMETSDGWTRIEERITVAEEDQTDAAANLTVGDYSISNPNYTRTMKVQWMRLSNTLRYTEDFTPDDMCEQPEVDGNTIGLWPAWENNIPPNIYLDNIQGDAAIDGVIINP